MCVFARLYCDVCDIYIKADRYTCEVEREEIQGKDYSKSLALGEPRVLFFFIFGSKEEEEGDEERGGGFQNRERRRRERDEKRLRQKESRKKRERD